jgi:hypothetical protein
MDWIQLAQDRVQHMTPANMAMIVWVPQKVGNFLTSWVTISFLRRTLVQEVSQSVSDYIIKFLSSHLQLKTLMISSFCLFVLNSYEMQCLTSGAEHKLQMFKNKVHGKMSGSRRDVTSK